jgi:nitrous oxide reductase accessory protein NosL
MKFLTALATVVLALLVASCESRWDTTPRAPTLIPSQSSPAATPVRWNLTMTITSSSGPRVDCFAPPTHNLETGVST